MQALDVVVVTPKLRGKRTIDIASYGLHVPVVVDDRLVEVGWGEASGLTTKEAFLPEIEQRARRQGYHFRLAPGAETPQESHDRVEDLTRQYRYNAAAFLCHSWLIRNYLTVQRGLGRDDMRSFKVANTEVIGYQPGSQQSPQRLYMPTLLSLC
jgi:broad specificity phosphatase PhoE